MGAPNSKRRRKTCPRFPICRAFITPHVNCSPFFAEKTRRVDLDPLARRRDPVGGKLILRRPPETKRSGLRRRLYSVGFDPLDGSSIIDANFAVGSIFGVWPGDKLLGRTGREQVSLSARRVRSPVLAGRLFSVTYFGPLVSSSTSFIAVAVLPFDVYLLLFC